MTKVLQIKFIMSLDLDLHFFYTFCFLCKLDRPTLTTREMNDEHYVNLEVYSECDLFSWQGMASDALVLMHFLLKLSRSSWMVIVVQ